MSDVTENQQTELLVLVGLTGLGRLLSLLRNDISLMIDLDYWLLLLVAFLLRKLKLQRTKKRTKKLLLVASCVKRWISLVTSEGAVKFCRIQRTLTQTGNCEVREYNYIKLIKENMISDTRMNVRCK